MKVICLYCRKETVENEPLNNDRISYSVCKECQESHPQIKGMSFNKYLSMFDVPAFIVDEDVRILAANKMAETLLGKPKENFVGLLGGEALECVYARLPGGCGKTVHCVTCAIRNTVISTIQSGVIHRHVPAKLHLEDEEIAMYLSTEIIGSSICIKIKMAD